MCSLRTTAPRLWLPSLQLKYGLTAKQEVCFAQVGMGEGMVQGQEMVDTDILCASIEALLRNGIRPSTPRDAWTSYLATHRDAPLDMLQEASNLAPTPGSGIGMTILPADYLQDQQE